MFAWALAQLAQQARPEHLAELGAAAPAFFRHSLSSLQHFNAQVGRARAGWGVRMACVWCVGAQARPPSSATPPPPCSAATPKWGPPPIWLSHRSTSSLVGDNQGRTLHWSFALMERGTRGRLTSEVSITTCPVHTLPA